MFLKKSLNLPVTEGHFVVIDKNLLDVLWLWNNATTLECYNNEMPICQPLLYLVGRIAHGNSLLGMTRVEFFLPLKEFLPQNTNCQMSINSSPCVGIKEVIKTPFIGYVKNTNKRTTLHSSSHKFFLRLRHMLLQQEWTMFLFVDTCTMIKTGYMMTYLLFALFVITNLFDDSFPKCVWDGIIVIQELC